jgi:cytochrome c553
MTHRMGAVMLALATGLGASAAAAQVNAGQDALFIKSLAATCANCHGTAGQAVAGSANVSLAGLDKNYLVTQMKAFKSGARPATVMHQLAKGYSDAQIDTMAAYFAAQKK